MLYKVPSFCTVTSSHLSCYKLLPLQVTVSSTKMTSYKPQVSNTLILSDQTGQKKEVNGCKQDLTQDGKFEKARVKGSQSYYIVYSDINYGEKVSDSKSMIVDSQSDVELGFVAKSTQGWDKTGITLLQHRDYRGTGVTFTRTEDDITKYGQISGACSFIVMKGVWALYTGKNKGGTRIKINGELEFGPGCRIKCLERASDMIQSIHYLRDN